MIRYEIVTRIRRPAAEVFDFAVTRQAENHPRWEPEVIEIRRDGPPAVGASGVMVRRDFGRVSELPLEILELVPDRLIRFVTDSPGIRFDITFEMVPVGGETEFGVRVEITVRGALRLLRPLLALMFRKNSARIVRRFTDLLHEPTAAVA